VASLRIQIGVEKFDGGERQVRLTPEDRRIDVAGDAAGIILMVASLVDATDKQPGDGDIDIPLGKIPQVQQVLEKFKSTAPQLAFVLSWLSGLMKEGDWNVFVKIARA